MRHRARESATRAVTVLAAGAGTAAAAAAAVAVAVAVAVGVAGCASATASIPAATRTAAPVYGPPAPDSACVAAKKADQTLQSRQGKDSGDEPALDQDFTNFAAALNADAQRETRPATAQAMTALANDYTDLVESQSGAAQLPGMSQVQKDGAAFDKACSL